MDGMTPRGPFHAGEIAMQERAGVRARMAKTGAVVIRDYMPDQHRAFFEKLPYLLVGSRDAEGRSWASMLFGRPGFVRTPDARRMEVRARALPGDPLAANLAPGATLGVLGIELATRRRNRMNGTVVALDEEGFALRVDQSFGNCPQYIQARGAEPVEAAPVAQAEGAVLSRDAAALVRRADTFFIATAAPGEGVDVSHRGGRPGFVTVSEENGRTVLSAPDFRGNFFFNTLGNIALEPRAGLLFPDFERGDLLSLTGEAEVIWDAAFAGAERLLRFRVARGVMLRNAMPMRWSAPDFARQLAD